MTAQHSYVFRTDPGHGWLQVGAGDLKALGLKPEGFSSYSYRSRDCTQFYLEEDCDASKFMDAYRLKYGERLVATEHNTDRDSIIRSMPRIK